MFDKIGHKYLANLLTSKVKAWMTICIKNLYVRDTKVKVHVHVRFRKIQTTNILKVDLK